MDGPVQPPSQEQLLFNAASRGDVERVRSRLMRASVSGDDRPGDTCKDIDLYWQCNGFASIHIAVKKNHIEVARALLDVDQGQLAARAVDGKTPVMIAATEGHLDMLRELYSRHLIYHHHETTGSAGEGVVESLAASTATVVEVDRDPDGNTALHYAAFKGHISIVEYLITIIQFDPLVTNNEGLTPLAVATAANRTDVVRFLLGLSRNDRNLSLEQPQSGPVAAKAGEGGVLSGYTCFHRAAMAGAIESLVLLLDTSSSSTAPIDIDMPNAVGTTMLHLAAQKGHLSICELLVNRPHCANVNAKNQFSLTPLMYACIGGHIDIVRFLLRNGADVHARNDSGAYALHLAAATGRIYSCSHPHFHMDTCIYVRVYRCHIAILCI